MSESAKLKRVKAPVFFRERSFLPGGASGKGVDVWYSEWFLARLARSSVDGFQTDFFAQPIRSVKQGLHVVQLQAGIIPFFRFPGERRLVLFPTPNGNHEYGSRFIARIRLLIKE